MINSHILKSSFFIEMNVPPDTKAEISPGVSPDKTTGLRRVPTQRRSQERVERILEIATRCIVEKGLDAVRMSEIAELSEVSIGSLYQYFPDKASIVMTLAERYNKEGRDCVEAELNAVNSEQELLEAMRRIVDGYYEMFLTEPMMQAIWQATQGDKSLQEIDTEDCNVHKSMLLDALVRLRPTQEKTALVPLAALVMQFIGTTVRLAISVDRKQGDKIIELFKKMLVNNLLNS
ncbi:MAG: TetR/AcrR family transcriptional regulator [Gammaproteobacteria bacterium]|nr:MAG: TetR/AcrR family transcriptional regulator [Gammaproteobacteria bacterium]